MKNKIDRMKTPAMRLSKRTVALILSVIMLVSSIATGSMLNTFAAYIKDNAAKTDAIADAASEGSAIAESAIPSEDDSPDAAAPDFIPNEVVRSMKGDLASVSAKADLAKIGDTTYYLWLAKDGGGNVASNYSNNGAMTANGDGTYTASFTISNNSNFAFCVCTSNSDKTSGFVTFPTTSVSVSSDLNSVQYQYLTINNTQYSFLQTNFKSNSSDKTVYVTCNPTSKTMSVSTTAPSGGGTTPTTAPSEGSTTNTVNKTSGKTIVFGYHEGKQWDNAHIWRNDTNETKIVNLGTNSSMTSYSSDDKLKYKDITGNTVMVDNEQINFILIHGTNWSDGSRYQSQDHKHSEFVKGTQYYIYTKTSSDWHSTDDGVYSPLKLVSIAEPATILKGQSSSFTVNTDGGVPWFYSEKLSGTAKNYTLKVGTTSGGSDVLAASTFNYTAKSKSFTWTPSSSGSVTLYYTLTDGIDTVTYSKTYSVIEPEVKHAVTFNTSGSGTVTPASGTEVGESTPTTITATPAYGYEFTGWTFGNGITGASTSDASTTIKTKSSGTYTVTANFALKSLSVNKGTHANGDFTLSTTTGVKMGDTITVSNIAANKGYTFGSISTSPSTILSGSGSSRTFTMPGEDVTVNAIFSPKTGNTITRTASPNVGGTVYCGTSSNTTSTTGNYTTGNTLYVRAAEKAGYDFNKIVVTYADGTTDESTTTKYIKLNTDGSKFSGANDGSISVVAYFTKKPTHKVTVVSNNNALGTATASVTEAYEGQTVTLTPKEDTGSFSSWSVTSGGVSVSNNKFTMGSSDVAITATFVEYSGTSNFYYNSYGDNGQPASSRYGAQMQKAKIGGVEYSYYHVSGRTESDQLFTVSYESPKYDNYECFFEVDSSWGSTAPQALFYASDEKNLGNWAQMYYIEEKNSKKRYRIAIPDGARSVRFKHGSNETAELYFTSGNNGWYTNGSMSSLTAYESFNPVETNFYENFNSTKYTDAFESKGFDNHNADRGQSHSYTKPKDLGAYSGDYYILVLEKSKTYTINGKTKTITNDPEIIWLPELPDSGDTIKVYAKDGAIRSGLKTYGNMADTTVLKADGTTSAGATSYGSDGQTYEVYKAQPGETIVIQTTIGNTACAGSTETYRDRFYVRGFSINGEEIGRAHV